MWYKREKPRVPAWGNGPRRWPVFFALKVQTSRAATFSFVGKWFPDLQNNFCGLSGIHCILFFFFQSNPPMLTFSYPGAD